MVGLVGVEAKLRAQLQRCSRERATRVKRQESSQVQERVKREEKREGASLARRFKQSVFWTSPKAAGPIRASVRGGAPPARFFHGEKNNF